MRKKSELLAPAGSWEALEAAVNAGADAVYLGGTNWSARAAADNFDRDGMTRAVSFAHRREVKIYVTVNTLVYDSEMRDLADELIFLSNAGVDAIIVQDLGVVRLARAIVPELPIHASTQMTLTNSAAIRFARDCGICRVVPARELSLSALKAASDQGVEIESFAHGSLCVCYSGQCLMSSLIGGRSGNRGRCAQPCRMPYTMVDERDEKIPTSGQYLLSPRDLSTLSVLPKLLEAGVFSFKIEGRMKRPEYVAVVTDVYRRALDACASGNFRAAKGDLNRLEAIFSRGFTTAFLEGHLGRAMMSDGRPDNRGVPVGRVTSVRSGRAEITLEKDLHRGDGLEFSNLQRLGTVAEKILQRGKDVEVARAGSACEISVPPAVRAGAGVFRTLDRQLVDEAGKFFGAKNVRTIRLDARVTASEGRPLEVVFTDPCGNSGTGVTDFPAEIAKNRPLDEATLRAQLGRLGGTDYSLGQLEFHFDGSLMVPAAELNKARRRALAELDKARLASFSPHRRAVGTDQISKILGEVRPRKNFAPRTGKNSALSVWTDTLEGTRAALKGGADRIIFGGDGFSTKNPSFEPVGQAVKIVRDAGREIAVATPRIVSEEQLPSFAKFLTEVQRVSPDFLCVHNIGLWQLARELKLTVPLWADMSLNIANGESLAFWAEKCAAGATPSIELNMARLRTLARSSPLPLECLVHGSVEMMVSEYCAAGSYLGKIDKGACAFGCAKKIFLRDRTGAKFRLAGDRSCRMHILNSQDLCAVDFVPRLVELGIGLRIDARFYDADETLRLTRNYRNALRGKKISPDPNTTRGHYARGAE